MTLNIADMVDDDGFGFDAGDGPSVCAETTFQVTNAPPSAIADNPVIIVAEDSGLSAVFDVDANDLATEGDAFTVVSHQPVVGMPISGILVPGLGVSPNANGTYQFNPNGQFEGLAFGESATARFDYTIEESSFSGSIDSARVTVQINGANDRPT